MKKLIISEKPSVAADIARVLGKAKKCDDYYENDQYVIASALGHLVELNMPADIDKKYARWTLSNLPIIPETFKLKPIEKTKAKLASLKKLLARKDIDGVKQRRRQNSQPTSRQDFYDAAFSHGTSPLSPAAEAPERKKRKPELPLFLTDQSATADLTTFT